MIVAELRGHLRRRAGFLATMSGTLALGLAAVSVAVALVHNAVWDDLPPRGRDRLVWIGRATPSRGEEGLSLAIFERWRGVAIGLERMALYIEGESTLLLSGEPFPVRTALVSDGFFETLGYQPVIGRGILTDDQSRVAAPVVVISHRMWRSRFGQDSAIVGRSVSLDGVLHRVVGVGDARLRFPHAHTDAFLPIARPFRAVAHIEDAAVAWGIGRLRNGADIGEVQAALQAATLPAASTRGDMAIVRSLVAHRARPFAARFALLGAGAILLLVLASSTAAILGATDDVRHARNRAVRAALGETRTMADAKLITEHLGIAAAAFSLATVLAFLVLNLLARTTPSLPEFAQPSLPTRVIVISLLIVMVPTIVLAFVRRRHILEQPLHQLLLMHGSGHTTDIRLHRFRHALIAVEITATVGLTCSAIAIAQQYVRGASTPLGMSLADVTTARIHLPYRVLTPPEMEITRHTVARFLEEVSSPASIVAVSSSSPMRGSPMSATLTTTSGDSLGVIILSVSPDYFKALRVPMLAGRSFVATDNDASLSVAVVSANVAKRIFNGNPVGQPARLRQLALTATIIGVVGDTRQSGIDQSPPPVIYLPFGTLPSASFTLMSRSPEAPQLVRRRMAEAHARVLPHLPPATLLSGEELSARALERSTYYSLALGIASILAALVAALGLYAVLALSSRQRMRELAIRRCVGAQSSDVMAAFLGPVLGATALGTMCGIAAAFLGAKVLGAVVPGAGAVGAGAVFVTVCAVAAVVAVAAVRPVLRVLRMSLVSELKSAP